MNINFSIPRRSARLKRSVISGALAFTFGYAACAHAALLYPEPVFTTGTQPYGIVSADVNKDGTADLVTVNHKVGSISVAIGNGDGTYKSKQDYPTGGAGSALAAGDLNGDGFPDIVTVNPIDSGAGTPGSISILLNNGDGTFAKPTQVTNPTTGQFDPEDVAIGDLDGDGDNDVVVADLRNAQALAFRGNGKGKLGNPNKIATGAGPNNVSLADVGGDDHLDVITSNSGANSISVAINQGNGTFQSQKSYSAGMKPGTLAVADVSGDGQPDAITGSLKQAKVSVLLANSDGSFKPATSYATTSAVSALNAADLDGDGNSDIIAANGDDNSISVLVSKGATGGFADHVEYPAGQTPFGIVTGNLNSDNKEDVAVVNAAGSNISVLIGKGDGTLQAPSEYATAKQPADVLLTDVDNDGKLDAVTANSGVPSNPGTNVSVLKGDGQGKFGSHQEFATGKTPNSIATADFDGNGSPDLVTADSVENAVSVLLNNGDGTFAAPKNPAVGGNPTTAVTTDSSGKSIDLDDDSHNDIIAVNENDNTLSVLLGKGDGTFQDHADYPTGKDPVAAAIGDVDGNGTLDAVTANAKSHSLSVLKGDGHGGFAAPTEISLQSATDSVQLADLNGDNHLDIVAAVAATNTTPSGLQVYLNNGDGTFKKGSFQATGSGPRSLQLADVNGDGKLDAVTANAGNTSSLSVLLGNGDGTFQPYTNHLPGANVNAVAVADVDGDNKPDLVSANFGGDTIGVLLQAATQGAKDHAPQVQDVSLQATAGSAASGQFKGSDQDQDALTYSIVKQPSHGSVKITDASKGTFTYTADSGFSGSDSFTYKANDGTLDSDPATVNVTVQANGGGNNPPPDNNGGGGGGGAFGPLGLLFGLGLLLARVLPERRRRN